MPGQFIDVVTKEYKPKLQSLKDDLALRKNKQFFWPTGTQVYCGRQGSGKTISAVKHLIDLKNQYPRAVVVSNLKLGFMAPVKFDSKEELKHRLAMIDTEHQYVIYSNMAQLQIALVGVNNGYRGVIYIVDEIHTYFNALDSKNIPMFVFTEISQQRKQRKLIIGTSQLFLRMAKPFREQCDNLIMCTTRFGIFTKQVAFDGMSLDQNYDGSLQGEVKKKGWFFHTRKLRKSFDTYQKVVSANEQYDLQRPLEITGRKGKKLEIKAT